ncbi:MULTISPECIES: hypothetical protein [Dictyoglomus]|jgi:hypothetical protein|uniref:Uncharacterized protein n=1 Tax=Dictyoglomus turgidum (strain DSM 6724 / Z-1310) TaxID=515635 RepID=B8DYK6_DICTD|nr:MULTISPECIES: hypothetical protein [Dictyoglomus]ACK41388.1 conserved hypothetical protein [Dictyoglomus turgidum DSM 6724]PNV80941.1 MAG: hypothetical protein C0196_00260 [Dictyoglomus turgidum]HBU31607.1 hypothetical protein [Dictyoglomus sp.]
MEFYRGVLVILFMGLILEIIVFIHYLSKWFFPFEFYLNLFDFFMTVGGIYAVIRHMIKTIRKG